jgi:hypothetical protein
VGDSVFSFRAFYHQLLKETGQLLLLAEGRRDAYRHVLLPWHDRALEGMAVLGQYGSLEAMTWRRGAADPCNEGNPKRYSCLECLYVLSRVSDILLPFQPVRYMWEDHIPAIQLEERSMWWRSLGMQEIDHPSFHPFYHEIVEVEQAEDPDEPISLLQAVWPGFMIGHMLFCRAGVRVRGGTRHVRKNIAETSRIYWTFARNNRPATDDSHGWGSNSQWATDFRRDYAGDDAYYYDVDGEVDIHNSEANVFDIHDVERDGARATSLITHRTAYPSLFRSHARALQ